VILRSQGPEVAFTDGSLTDNSGLLHLLQRRVGRIVWMLGPKEDVEGMLWKKFWCRFVAEMCIENLRIEFGKLKFSRSSAGHECRTRQNKTIGKRSLRSSGNWIQISIDAISDHFSTPKFDGLDPIKSHR